MADAVPVDRLPYGGTWNGIVGGREVDPTARTRFVGPLPTSTSLATINSQLAACPSGQYVELAAGTFNLNGNLTISSSGKTLRGAVDANGRPATVLNFASGFSAIIRASTWDFGSSGAGQFTTVDVNSGGTRGSSTLTLSGTPSGLSSGRLMWISAPKNAPTIDGGGWTDWFGTRPFTQWVKVTGVSGNNVSFYFNDEPYQSATFLSQIVFFHGSHCHYNLFEGNWVATHYNDLSSSGNMSHSRNNLFVRQRMLGWDPSGPKD